MKSRPSEKRTLRRRLRRVLEGLLLPLPVVGVGGEDVVGQPFSSGRRLVPGKPSDGVLNSGHRIAESRMARLRPQRSVHRTNGKARKEEVISHCIGWRGSSLDCWTARGRAG